MSSLYRDSALRLFAEVVVWREGGLWSFEMDNVSIRSSAKDVTNKTYEMELVGRKRRGRQTNEAL